MLNAKTFLLLNLALAFYNVGTIWAHEIDIFRNWRFLDAPTFHRVQAAHWQKLPYWVLAPVALGLAGALALILYHPDESPPWIIWTAVAVQIAPHVLTAAFWGPWQAKLSLDEGGGDSPYLARIVATHWIRAALVTIYGVILLLWSALVQ